MRVIILVITLVSLILASENSKCLELNINKIENGDIKVMKEYMDNCKSELSEESIMSYVESRRQKSLKSDSLVCIGDSFILNKKLRNAYYYYAQGIMLENDDAKRNIAYMNINFNKELDNAYSTRIDRPYYTKKEMEIFVNLLNKDNKSNFIDNVTKRKNLDEIKSHIKNCSNIIQIKKDEFDIKLIELEKSADIYDNYNYIEYLYLKDTLGELRNVKRRFEY
ncbi:MAG: hypothetical protein WBF48_01035 [Halarcobacter sp.]